MPFHAPARVTFALLVTTFGAQALSASLPPHRAPDQEWARQASPGVLEFSGQLIVRPRQDLDAQRAAAARQRLQPLTLKYYPQTDEYVVAAPARARAAAPGAPEGALAADLLATGDYQYAHPNWICYPVDIPNDPGYSSQWHHPMMQSPQAWEITHGSSSVICAVTDTGIDLAHPDLAAHRVPGFNSFTDTPETSGGDVSDINGHGTHVAGCAAAIGNNAVGVAGVAWNVRIMMVRVCIDSSGSAYLDDILQGARWAIENGAKVASSSYTGVSSASVQTTGAYIKSIGGLYCYAAGNAGNQWTGFDWADTIVVGASDESDNRAGFSGYGLPVDVFAPGSNILSTCNGGGYCYASGTSMATPVCNGVIGLIWSANPSLTPQQVENILFTTSNDWGDPGNDTLYGWGRVNTFQAVSAAVAASGPVAPYAVADDGGAVLFGTPRRIDVLANDFDLNNDPIVISAFDPASAHGGTITRSVGTGPGGRDELLYSAPPSYYGADTFNYTIRDPGNLTDSATVTVQVSDPADFRDPENPLYTAPGARVDYYALATQYSFLPDFSTLTPYLSEIVTDVNYPSTGGNFAGSGRADDVGARFTGYVTVPATDYYLFYTNSDDGSRLWIGDRLVVDNDGLHGMQEIGSSIALKAGTHAITVDFFERGGGAGVIVSVSSPSLPKQVVPASMWSHDSCPADYNGDGFVDGIDYDTFVNDFEAGNPASDFNGDGFVDGIDYDQFMNHFEAGC